MAGAVAVAVAALAATAVASPAHPGQPAHAAHPARSVPRPNAHYEGHELAHHHHFVFRFRISSHGHRVVRLTYDLFTIPCKGNSGILQAFPNRPVSAPIGHDLSFSAAIPTTGKSPVLVHGRFRSSGEARGTASFHGVGDQRGCNSRTAWTARIPPPPPPRLHFAGHTSPGTAVTFDRTIQRHPHALNFDFGTLVAHCVDGSTRTVQANSNADPRIRHGRFSGVGFDLLGEVVSVTGRFSGRSQVSGTVSFTGRDDCSFGPIPWSATLVRRAPG